MQKYAYDAYGGNTNTLTEIGPGATSYAFRYTGQRLDGGTGLYDDKARFYSSALGRFLQPDAPGKSGDPNLYEYVNGDPVGQTDPSGECPLQMCGPDGGALDLGVQGVRGDDTRLGGSDAGGSMQGFVGATQTQSTDSSARNVPPSEGGSGYSNQQPTSNLAEGTARMATECAQNCAERRGEVVAGMAATAATGAAVGGATIAGPAVGAWLSQTGRNLGAWFAGGDSAAAVGADSATQGLVPAVRTSPDLGKAEMGAPVRPSSNNWGAPSLTRPGSAPNAVPRSLAQRNAQTVNVAAKIIYETLRLWAGYIP